MEKLSLNKPQISVPTPDITHSISLKMYLAGGAADGYQIQDFQIGFQQDFDYKGQPQHEVTGGIFSIVITQIPDAIINKWMMNSRLPMEGSFVFKHLGYTLLTIVFEEAYCIDYKKNLSSVTGVATRIIISPKIVTLGNKRHENLWKM
jgi:hypothetical protein